MKQTNWASHIECPNCGTEYEVNDVLSNNVKYDGDHQDKIPCDECGCLFDCYLSVTYHFKTIERNEVSDED